MADDAARSVIRDEHEETVVYWLSDDSFAMPRDEQLAREALGCTFGGQSYVVGHSLIGALS